MTKPANDDKPVTSGNVAISPGPDGHVMLVFETPIRTVGFSVPEALIVATALIETSLQIMTAQQAVHYFKVDDDTLPN